MSIKSNGLKLTIALAILLSNLSSNSLNCAEAQLASLRAQLLPDEESKRESEERIELEDQLGQNEEDIPKENCLSRLKSKISNFFSQSCIGPKRCLTKYSNVIGCLGSGIVSTGSNLVFAPDSAAVLAAQQNFGNEIHKGIKRHNIIFKIVLTYGCAFVIGNLDYYLGTGMIRSYWSFPFFCATIASARHFINQWKSVKSKPIETGEDVIETVVKSPELQEELLNSQAFQKRLDQIVTQKITDLVNKGCKVT